MERYFKKVLLPWNVISKNVVTMKRYLKKCCDHGTLFKKCCDHGTLFKKTVAGKHLTNLTRIISEDNDKK